MNKLQQFVISIFLNDNEFENGVCVWKKSLSDPQYFIWHKPEDVIFLFFIQEIATTSDIFIVFNNVQRAPSVWMAWDGWFATVRC